MNGGRFLSRRSIACAAVLLLTACEQGAENAATEGSAVSATQALPDWRGWWSDDAGFLGTAPGSLREVLQNPEVYLPEARAAFAPRATGENPGDGAAYCVPTRFNGGTNGGRTNPVEFLLRPERLTITNGDGLLRRISIDGRPLRENPEPSNGGTSVGVWEGDTLVIETVGLHPDTTFPTVSRPATPQIGENVHVIERIRLNEEDKLVVETELTAPELLAAPVSFTTVYRRRPDYVYRDHDVCSLNDRSIDPETGLERLDLTPPPNLPPPPPR